MFEPFKYHSNVVSDVVYDFLCRFLKINFVDNTKFVFVEARKCAS